MNTRIEIALLAAATATFAACGGDEHQKTDAGDAAPDAGAERPDEDGPADVTLDTSSSPDRDGPLACQPVFLNRQWGTSLDDRALAVSVDLEGNVYVAGYERGIDGHSVEPVGQPVGFVERWSRGGRTFRYERSSDGADVIDAIDVRADGHVVFAGRHVPKAGSTRGDYDLVLGHLDDSGRLTSARIFGGPRPEHPRRLATMAFTTVVVGYTDLHIPANQVEALEDPLVHLSRASTPPEFFGSSFWSWEPRADL